MSHIEQLGQDEFDELLQLFAFAFQYTSDNETLPEERLAKDLGISRTPLRDALNWFFLRDSLFNKKVHQPTLQVLLKKAPWIL